MIKFTAKIPLETHPQFEKFGKSNFNANKAYRNYTLQPLNSVVVNQERNKKHQMKQNLQPKSTNSSPKRSNANGSSEKCKSNHSVATCPEHQLFPPSERFSIVSKKEFLYKLS